jgi:hypothetical protein
VISYAPKITAFALTKKTKWRTDKWEESLVNQKKRDAKSLHGTRSASSSNKPLARSD